MTASEIMTGSEIMTANGAMTGSQDKKHGISSEGSRSQGLCRHTGALFRKIHYLCSELIQNDMNLRDIKKDIEYVVEAFLTDCDAFCYVNPKADQAAVAELYDEAVDLYNSLKDKAAAREIEGSKKAYFTGLRKELVEKTDALYQKLSDLVKKTK